MNRKTMRARQSQQRLSHYRIMLPGFLLEINQVNHKPCAYLL